MTARDDVQRQIDRLAKAVDSGRLRGDLADLFDEEPFTRLAEWAESLQTIADDIDNARDAIESWRDADDRETRAASKDEALGAIETMLQDWDASPLDVAALHDYEPEDGDS